ncbi:MAG: CHAT domain-containing protein [Cyanobacteria bacterium P01_F01_bin.86]
MIRLPTLLSPRWAITPVLALGLLSSGALFPGRPGFAQIVPDDTLGPESSVVPIGAESGTLPNVLIEGGVQQSTTLFHSFEEFNINSGQQVRFANPAGVENIFSRVTGGMLSEIDGLLGVNGLANLFFLNPQGVVLGPNAQLDLNGALVVTTAEQFSFTDGIFFSAINPEAPPLLTVSVPLGLRFGAYPQPVEVNGADLTLAPGRPLVLLGGDVTLEEATVTVPGGALALGGLAEAGTLTLNLDATAAPTLLSIPEGLDQSTVSLLNGAIAQTLADGNGDIIITAQNLNLADSQLLTGITANAGTMGSQAGTITLRIAEDIEVSGTSSIRNQIQENALGNGGDILIRAANLTLMGSGNILTDTLSSGTAGSIAIDVTDRILLTDRGNTGTPLPPPIAPPSGPPPSGSPNPPPNAPSASGPPPLNSQNRTFIASASESGGTGATGHIMLQAQDLILDGFVSLEIVTDGPGNGGDITLATGSLQVEHGGFIHNLTDGLGNTGNIAIDATAVQLDTRANRAPERGGITTVLTRNAQDSSGGYIVIEAQNLTVIGAQIGSIVGGVGQGGDIIIRAADTVQLTGDETSDPLSLSSGAGDIFSAIRPTGSGAGGNVAIAAQRLILANGAEIDASASGPGRGGDITIAVSDTIALQGVQRGQPSRILTQLNAGVEGAGGDIAIATNQLTVQDGGQISAATLGIGPSGEVSIQAQQGITLMGASPRVNLPPVEADAPLLVDATGTLFPSGIFTSSPGVGRAGNLDITTPTLVVQDQAQISASSETQGPTGNLTITANTVTLDNAVVSAETIEGADANINLWVQDRVQLFNGSRISANASSTATGGNVQIIGPDLLLLADQSSLTAENSGGTGDGGNITLSSELLLAAPDGFNRIIANAFEGNGGNIDITATSLFGEPFLDLSASSQLGLPGNITIDSPDIDPARSLTELPTNRVDTRTLIADACAVDGNQPRSQFVVTGPGGLPTQPTTHPTGLFLLPDLGPLAVTPPTANPVPLTEAQNWSVAANGNIVLAANPINALETLLWEASQAYQQANYGQAVTLWTEAAAILVPANDAVTDASILSNLALAYHHLGAWEQAQEAIAASQQILTPTIATHHPELLAQTFNTQASLELVRGHAAAALSHWQQAAEAYQQAGDTEGKLRALLNQTQAWQSLGFHQRAAEQLTAIATALADQPPSVIQAITLLHLGNVQRAQGEIERSQSTLTAALVVAQALPYSTLNSTILLNLGHTAQAQANPEQALTYYQQSLATASTPLLQFQAQVSQLDLLVDQDMMAAQILWSTLEPTFQQQVNTLPASREAIYAQLQLAATLLSAEGALVRPDQTSRVLSTASSQAHILEDAVAQTYILGYQAQVYSQTEQWAEAQLLTEQALQQAHILDAPEMIYQWAWQLGQVRQAQGDRAGAIAAYQEAIDALSVVRVSLNAASDDVQFTFRDTVEPVYRELVKLLLQGEAGQPVEPASLEQARLLVENLQLAELQDYFQDVCIQGESIIADAVDPTAAVIYPIVLDDRLDVIVSVAGQPLHHHSMPIAPGQVEQTVTELLRSLTTPLGSAQTTTTQQLQQVYDWLIAPIAAMLEQQSIQTLVFVADGALRTLPLTALHDGDQYLIERYNVVSSPGLTLLDPRPLERQGLQVLAGGLSESRPGGFPPLPFVADEIEQITTQIPNHQVLFNQELTRDNLTTSLATTPAAVIHLATHATFGATAEETFILTWDGKVTMKELGGLLQARDRSDALPIELLVFSACKTATGDSRAVLGIAGVAIRSGVRSTLAGLWPLNDQATAVFMEHFYEALAQPEVTKAEAFRQAQLTLMADPQFNTPYYWGPFVMVGNWL